MSRTKKRRVGPRCENCIEEDVCAYCANDLPVERGDDVTEQPSGHTPEYVGFDLSIGDHLEAAGGRNPDYSPEAEIKMWQRYLDEAEAKIKDAQRYIEALWDNLTALRIAALTPEEKTTLLQWVDYYSLESEGMFGDMSPIIAKLRTPGPEEGTT